MIPDLHHIGIIVPTEEDAARYATNMGMEEDFRGVVPKFECLCIFMKAPPGGTAVELVVPSGGSLARFNKGTGGLHHYALKVKDLDQTRRDLAAKDMRLLESEHVLGAGGRFLANFIDPKCTRGVMIEYVQLL